MSFRGGGRSTQRTILPFGLEYADIISSTQETEKPKLLLPINGEVIEIEQSIAKQTINFSKIMSDGPFFTGNLDSINISEKKNISTTAASDGIERYSDRYKKIQKIGSTIEEHPYQTQFFPTELYSVMGITNKDKKKFLSLSKFHSNGGLREFLSNEQIENMDEEAKVKAMKERMLSLANAAAADNDDNNNKEENHHSGDEEEDIDDEFEDDDDDDYNAEKYFDDGDDDGGDDGGDDEAAF